MVSPMVNATACVTVHLLNGSDDLIHSLGLDSLHSLRNAGGDVSHELLIQPGLDAVHHGTDHLNHWADPGHGGLHVGAGHPGHLRVGGAHQWEGHRLVHHLHALHGGDDASGDVINLDGSHFDVK